MKRSCVQFKSLSKSVVRFCALTLLFNLAVPTFAAYLPTAAPSTVGMSAKQLARIDDAVAESINKHEMPGAVVLTEPVNRTGRALHVPLRTSPIRRPDSARDLWPEMPTP